MEFTEEQKRYIENDINSLYPLVMMKSGRRLTDYEKLQIEKEYKTASQIKALDMKKLIVDAIIGCGNIKSYHNTRYCKYAGNQWNGNFEWVREQLEIQTLEVLVDMYSFLIIK